MSAPWKRSALLVAGLAMLAALPATSQRGDGGRIIDLHVNAEQENRSFSASVLEGERFRMTFHGIGTFEILPRVVNEAAGAFRVTVYAGAENAESGSLKEAETVTARIGVPVALRSMPSVGLVIDGFRPLASRLPDAAVVTFAASTPQKAAADSCCVTCGNVTACGCAVSGMSCGSCCSGQCCPREPLQQVASLAAPNTFGEAEGQCGNAIPDAERLFTAAARI